MIARFTFYLLLNHRLFIRDGTTHTMKFCQQGVNSLLSVFSNGIFLFNYTAHIFTENPPALVTTSQLNHQHCDEGNTCTNNPYVKTEILSQV